MIRIAAILILAVLELTGPAGACSTKSSSTFCADGWVAQPTRAREGRDAADGQGEAWLDDGSGTDPSFGGDGIYVEGAVAVEGPVPGDDGQL